MKIKRFICDNCGAPKVNTYSSPYVVCDYCCHLMDIDYAAGLEVWNQSAEHTQEYVSKKAVFESNIANYLLRKNKEAYKKEQYNYWDFYYKHYPQYLPPNIPVGEKYHLFLESTAQMLVDSAFNPPPPDVANAYNQAYASLEYYNKDGKNFVTMESFSRMIKAYMDYQEQGFRIMYDNPEYHIMQELLPEKLRYKLSLSQIAQVWIPYLEEEHASAFLKEHGLTHEYADVATPIIQEHSCSHCNQLFKIPAGAVQAICPHCRGENNIIQAVHCKGCGVENQIPEKWKVTIECTSCGTELKVVQPLFG